MRDLHAGLKSGGSFIAFPLAAYDAASDKNRWGPLPLETFALNVVFARQSL